MKNQIVLALALAMVAAFGTPGMAQPDPSVNWKKAQDDSYFRWLEHLNIPTTAVLQAKSVETSAAAAEIADLKTVARKIFKPALGLSGASIEQGVIPVPNLHNGSDVLVLQQETPVGRAVVQDDQALTVLVDPRGTTTVPLEKASLEEYVMDVARSVLNIPGAEQDKQDFTFFLSSADIGNSKAGAIYYGMNSSQDWQWKHWYSAIKWWSDGHRVMFEVDKYGILHPQVDRSTHARSPEELTQPRKFRRP